MKMKKVIAIIAVCILLAVSACAVSSCGNKDMFDTNYSYDYALISFPDGTTEKIEIKQWRDYEDGEQLQIIAKDGTVYLVSSVNCVLVNEK